MARPQLLSGARGVIKRYNPATQSFEPIAFATDITVNVRVGNTPTYVMGRMNAGAIDPTSYDVDVSIGRVIPMNAPNAQASNAPSLAPRSQTVTAIGVGLETVVSQMVSAEDIVIAIQDKVTGKYVSAVRGCRFAGRGLRSGATDVGAESINFVGIYDSGFEGENAASSGYGL